MNLKKAVKYLLPVSVKKWLKYTLYCAQDFVAYITGKSDDRYPPKRLNFVGSSEFKKVGEEFVDYFIRLGGLKPSDTVLDIGSGIGRMAIPLKEYLKDGKYYGFDIDKRGVEWCQQNISKVSPNFHFEYVDIYNKYYNQSGKIQAHEFVFPYADNTFTFIFATSVFTHMMPNQIDQYFSEIRRVLKPGGTCFFTWFSIDKEADANIQNKTSFCDLRYKYNDYCFYSHKNSPEAEIGYTEDWICNALKQIDCHKDLKIHHGSWAQRKEQFSYQDIFISKSL
ncbi:SAM-dependent methyltransferase [Candidatus Peregrinibacteria bacterium]|nr:MAG: SAM-dependent methyltransferase [Candidatus Peregrinibacteria bacterium]